MIVRPTTDFADFAFLALSYLATQHAANLFDPRLHHEIPASIATYLHADAEILTQLSSRLGHRIVSLHALPLLHPSLDAFARSCARTASDLNDNDVAAPFVLHTLRAQALEVFELLRADMALCLSAFRSLWLRHWQPALQACAEQLSSRWTTACTLLQANVPIELSYALGAHGRVLDGRVIVGAALQWNALSLEHVIIQAMHECCVSRASQHHKGYLAVEWNALQALTRLLHTNRSRDESLCSAHTAWLASMDLSWIAERAAEQLGLPAELAEQLRAEGPLRVQALLHEVDT